MQTMTSLAKLCAEAPGWATAVPFGPAPTHRLSFDGECYDVAVVGAGITGLIAGIRAARAGRRVAVFEAAEPGAGASGRNSGFVIPALSRANPETLAQAWGTEAAAHFGTTLAGAANARDRRKRERASHAGLPQALSSTDSAQANLVR